MRYVSTRGEREKVTPSAAIIRGLAPDRGLYVPESIPALPLRPAAFKGMSYDETAKTVLSAFLTDFDRKELEECVKKAYDEKFDTTEIAPVIKTNKAFFLELWHGNTAAFKDMALSILPWLLKTALKKEGENKKIAVLTATSGDTGKAALSGFADVSGTEIIVFYPKDGVSVVQERQMTTQRGCNVHVYGIRGNFDEAQTGVKNVFNDTSFAEELSEKNIRLSSANSINIGRLVPQVAYYVNAYAKLLAGGEIIDGEKINICVPTGNFGNILSAWYAKQMGLPVACLICASNENKILTDFINTGVYDRRREFILTSSPSMDILVSSNLERLLWHLSGQDSERIVSLMTNLDKDGFYDAGAETKEALGEFHGGFSCMEESHAALARLWHEERYLIDTHTAVAYAVYLDYLARTGDNTKTLIASTASPYKFAGSVAGAIGLERGENEFITIEKLRKETDIPIPRSLSGLDNMPILHENVIEKTEIGSAVKKALLI
jgi:threonine synthase